jgi:L-malate glycosyltransferase
MTDARRPLHVLMLLGGSYPPPKGGGTQAQVRLLAKALRTRGHKVTVLAPLIHPGSERRVERLDGVPVCRLAFPHLRVLGSVCLMSRLFLFLLFRRNRYDVWHAHSPRRVAAVAALLGSRCEKPVVVVKVASAKEFDTGTLSPRPSPIGRVIYLCLKHADAWQAISGRIARALAAKGIPEFRIAAIPNAVDVGRFRRIPRFEARAPRFLFIGRLVPVKNLSLLLEAFAELLRSHPDAQLRIVGGGALDASLKQQARALGIAASVEFTGHREDIEALIADADFGVLPSSVEGLSNSLLESMASGLPMIASRVSGSEDLVHTGKNGWLFEPDDRKALTACLVDAAALSPQRRDEFSAEARATIERHASLDSVLERMTALYRGSTAPAEITAPAASEIF